MAIAKGISERSLAALPAAEFWASVAIGREDECWPWRAQTNDKGYGRFAVDGAEHKSHRVAFALGKRTGVPGVVMVCHRCDNPACCNPHHLFLGLAKDNNEDRSGKGRTVAPRSLANGNGKLSDAQVRDVLTSREPGAAIARRFGVSPALVSMIRNGRRRQMVGDAGVEPATFRV